MEKENSATAGGGGGGGGGNSEQGATNSTPDHLQAAADQANSLLDPSALFGAYWPRGDAAAASSLFGGMPDGYGLGSHHLPSAYAILGRGGAGAGSGYPSGAPPPPPYSHAGGLGGLGMNSAAWWTMATHLATQDYLARLQGAAGLSGFSPGAESLLPPYTAMQLSGQPKSTGGSGSKPKSAKSSSSSGHKSVREHHHHHQDQHRREQQQQLLTPTTPALSQKEYSNGGGRTSVNESLERQSYGSSQAQVPASVSSSAHHNSASTAPGVTPSTHPAASSPNILSNSPTKEGSDPNSILGGVRLPPDTEIIKYTSSIVGPKIPGTTNRGRKKTISLDSPSISLHGGASLAAHQTNSLLIEPTKYNRSRNDSGSEYRDQVDRVEVIKLPAHSTNGSILSTPPTYTSSGGGNNASTNSTSAGPGESDAPLNLSLKPTSGSSRSSPSSQQPLSQLSNLSQSLLASSSASSSDRTCKSLFIDADARRKPGPKPRRVPQNSIGAPPSSSVNPALAQLFAAADSPQRPSSGSEESESTNQGGNVHHKDRPRNLGRGVSKPKKNTVASLLAQSRALGIKPTPSLDPNVPLSHQVSLLRSNILAAQIHAQSTMGLHDDKNQEKMKHKLLEASGEESNMDVTSESGSNSDACISDTDEENPDGGVSPAKKRKLNRSMKDLEIVLDRGWKRETVITGIGKGGYIQGDVTYYSPCGKSFRSSSELLKFLETQNPAELTAANFTFNSKPLVGEFLQPTMGLTEGEFVRLSAQEVARRLEELRLTHGFGMNHHQYQRDKLAYAKKLAKEEAQRHKEQARLIKEQEKTERQEAMRRERELRNQQLMEGRKRLAFTIKQKMKIIQEIERGKSKSDVARELGLASSTVATIWKNRESIAESWRNRDMMAAHSDHHHLDLETAKKIISQSQQQQPASLTTPTAAKLSATSASEPSVVPTSAHQPDHLQQAQSQTQSQELLEARKKRHEEAEKCRIEEQHRRQQERELKRQQAVIMKEQMYMQELTKQREMLYTVELERERRRQHMALIKALENRRKMEEREKKRLEARAERIASKEKRLEQRRIELELVELIRKPVEDMELTDHKPLPEIKRVPGLKLSSEAFASIVMVFEFLHNFGETLGFDMESLPTLKSLQAALLNDEEAEEEILSVISHLLVCAIEDPGIPQPARHTTGLGQSLRQAEISHANISEVLRIYLYANATGEVKALTGLCLERERDKRFADHHQNAGDNSLNCSSKNVQFYEHLHNNDTWKMSERLRDKPFLALNPTHKAQMLAFLCNELLQNKAVLRQIDQSLENVAQLKKERFLLDTKIRKLRQLHSRKARMEAVGVVVNKSVDGNITIEKKETVDGEESNTNSTAMGTTPTPEDQTPHEEETNHHDEEMSENESEGTQPEEEEDKNLSAEELGKKLDKLLKQSEEQLQKLNGSSKGLRAHVFGQDRYWRRYWELPRAGGVYVESMESAEPEILELQAELDEKYKNMVKVEPKKEEVDEEEGEKENETPNEVKEEKMETGEEEEAKKELENCVDEVKNSEENELKTETEEGDAVKKEQENGPAEQEKPAVKTEDKVAETVANGDKFSHVNNLHPSKEVNGSLATEVNSTESNWFSILPRETCDTSGPSTKQIFGVVESAELKIPIFPPPASPSYDRCDSPAPLILTQDEATQLEYLKVHGLPPPGEAKPVPEDLRHGWWRITDVETFQELLEHLHSRGVREKELKRTTWAAMESFLAVTGKINVDPGNMEATDLADDDDNDSDLPPPVPKLDRPEDWSEQVAMRVDAQLLEQVEALEDKVANASMQVKGWKLPPRAGTEEAEEIEKINEMEQISAVEQARQRLLSLEAAIERRYLKPPLGVCTGDTNLAALKAEQAAAAASAQNAASSSNDGMCSVPPSPPEETTPRGLNNWREATARAHTSAQLAMALYMLEASIAWDKSIMKANCQFCHSGDNEDKLLLCDGCDRGYHTYCFRPKMENIPDGDWYCHECMNKATGERNCLVCGKRVGKNLVLCELCPRAYHTDCHNPVMPKIPRGKWYCSNCHSKQPKKRNSSRRSNTKGGGEKGGSGTGGGITRDSESSDHPPASPTPSTASNAHVEDVSSSEPPTPTASPRKEVNCSGNATAAAAAATVATVKSLTKKQQRELAPCKTLLEQLEQQEEAWPFLLPVNTKQFPTYKKIIKTPMDLSTIKKKLQDSVYKSRDDFCADVRQMLTNCEVFNEDDSPVGKAGHGMRTFFETRWTEITGAPPPPPLHPQTHS